MWTQGNPVFIRGNGFAGFTVGIPMGQDSATFWDKGTAWQAQNLAKGLDGPGQPVKIRDGTQDGTRDGTVQDFDSLWHRPVGIGLRLG